MFMKYVAVKMSTVMILSFWTDRSGQWTDRSGQTQIRLLLEEKSDQGIHCSLFHLHLFDEIPYGLALLFDFYKDYSTVFRCPKI